MKRPDAGGVVAKDAYISPTFKLNRQYAEKFGDQWIILSAKYGFISPEFVIPGPYDVTFIDRKTQPISYASLQQQAIEQELAKFDQIIGLGGKEYRQAIAEALPEQQQIVFPFAGLTQGRMNQATKRSILAGVAFPVN